MIIGASPTASLAQAAALVAVSAALIAHAQSTTTGIASTTMPERADWTPVAQASSQESAFEPKLILLTQSQLPDATGSIVFVYPSYIATKVAHIETLPFDGIALHWPLTYSLMNGALHSVATIAAHWAPLDGAAWSRMQHNFAIVGVDRPADFFDSWANTVQSFANLATVLQDIGVTGIMFDNEDYGNELWEYPGDVSYSSTKTLQQYYDQARLRGGEIMAAIQAVAPTMRVMVLISPSHNTASTPSLVYAWGSVPNQLAGAFSVGLMEQTSSSAPIIDGHEGGYGFRSQAEFDASVDWHKTGMPSAAAACPFIPTSFRTTYPSRVSVSHPTYNQTIAYAAAPNPRVMDITVYPTVLEMSMLSVEEYAWLYWESNGNWYNPIGSTYGVPTAWHDATETVWNATRAGALLRTAPGKRKGQIRKP